jgi:GTPase
MGSQRTGKSGDDIVLRVPVGTEILDEDEETVIADLTEVGQRVLLAKGGNGGWGNLRSNPRPTGARPRQPGAGRGGAHDLAAAQADRRCGAAVGLPNAGKSTFLRPCRMPGPRSRIIPSPRWSRTWGCGDRRAGIRDGRYPGPDRGRSEGRGLGDQFLAHVERCAVLLHLVDGTSSTITKDYRTIVHRAGSL